MTVLAIVSSGESDIVETASQHIVRALTEASGQTWQSAHHTLDGEPEPGAILVTSFGPEVDRDEDWPATEARLRERYARWSQGSAPLFICTVLRVVRDADDLRRLVRIRRLNLLAAQLSHETGAFVIDIDRTLADIGADRLGTDYRLQSDAARDQASKCIAVSIIANGLDQLASFEVQDRAAAIMARYQPALGLPPQLRPQQLLAIGRGRRRQMAAVEAVSPEQRHLFLIRQVLTRQIGVGTAAVIFVRAVRHVGLRQSVVLLTGALRRLVSVRG